MANRWRHCADLTGPGIEPKTSRTDSVRLATELTAGPGFHHLNFFFHLKNIFIFFFISSHLIAA